MRWTPEAETLLRNLWLAGHSAAVIAQKLQTSRNSIIGKKDRMHLPSRATTACTIQRRPVFDFKRRSYPEPKLNTRAGTLPRRVRRPALASLGAPVPRSISLLDLEASDCRFICEGSGAAAKFCGTPQTTSSRYCAYHHGLCHEGSHG